MTHHLRWLVRGLLPLALLALAACHESTPTSGGGAAEDTVQELNSQLMALLAALADASPAEVDAIQEEAATVLLRRRLALAILADESPVAAVALALTPDLLAAVAAAFPAAAAELETWGEREGAVESEFVDEGEDAGRFEARIVTADEVLSLRFATAAPPLISGTLLRAGGVLTSGRLVAVGAERLPGGVGAANKAPGDPPLCGPTGDQRIVALLVHGTEEPTPAMSPSSWADVFFSSTDSSLDDYWREASYGLTSASGDVVGYFVLDQAVLSSNLGTITRAAVAAADSAVDFQAYSRIFVLHPWPGTTWGTQRAGGAAGVGSFGCWGLSSSGDGSFTASTSAIGFTGTIDRALALHMLVHEGGHNLGLAHSASRTYGAEVLGGPGDSGDYQEYGDIVSSMGSLAVHGLNHYPAAHKARLGWLPAGAVSTVTSPGTFTIAPFEQAAEGPLALRVRRGDDSRSWLWLEYRQPIGYDQGTSTQITGGLVVHLEDPATGYAYTNLLDFTPDPGTAWPWNPGFEVGTGWTDLYSGLSLQVSGATPANATVEVGYGSTPCVEADPLVALAPPTGRAEPGGQVDLEVTVVNRDTSGCAARSFALESALPAGWASSFSLSPVTLDPGVRTTVVLSKGVPAGVTLGTYAVDASASSGSSLGAASTYLTVSPPPVLVVNLLVGAAIYPSGATVPLRALVTFGPSPVSGARVTITVTEPDGKLADRTFRTRSSGQVEWSYRPRKTGRYATRAEATSEGRTVVSAQAYFDVQ